MTLAVRRPRPTPAALLLACLLVLPLFAAGGPAAAGPAGIVRDAQQSRAATAPESNVLAGLSDLLARLLPLPAPTGPGVPSDLVSRVTASTVRVNGVACDVRVAGSGFSVAPDTVVTNAHVVAGTTATSVLRPDGRTLPATVEIFDPNRDLALLSVPGLGEPALGFASAAVGESDAVFGHPRGQAAVAVEPAVVARRVTIDIGNIYDQPAGDHQILLLTANIAPGDSGSPVVNRAGQVVGVAFATATFRRSTAFAVASEEVGPVLAQPRSGAVSTGPCING